MTETAAYPVEDGTDLLILLLYAPGKSGRIAEPVAGTTRLQKLFFLLREGEGPSDLVKEAQDLLFEAHKMGPYSMQLRNVVADLQAAGIIEVDHLDYILPDDVPDDDDGGEGRLDRTRKVTSSRYRLSDDLGRMVGAGLWAGLDESVGHALSEFKDFFNSISLRQLLIFTYEKFPKYTTRSTIKEQLGIYES